MELLTEDSPLSEWNGVQIRCLIFLLLAGLLLVHGCRQSINARLSVRFLMIGETDINDLRRSLATHKTELAGKSFWRYKLPVKFSLGIAIKFTNRTALLACGQERLAMKLHWGKPEEYRFTTTISFTEPGSTSPYEFNTATTSTASRITPTTQIGPLFAELIAAGTRLSIHRPFDGWNLAARTNIWSDTKAEVYGSHTHKHTCTLFVLFV